MNPRQAKFAAAYARCGVAETAALEAGYSRTTARAQGTRLLANVGIQAEIARLAKMTEQGTIANLVEVRERWTAIMRDDDVDVGQQLRASELLAKSLGGFIERVQVSKGVPISVDELV